MSDYNSISGEYWYVMLRYHRPILRLHLSVLSVRPASSAAEAWRVFLEHNGHLTRDEWKRKGYVAHKVKCEWSLAGKKEQATP